MRVCSTHTRRSRVRGFTLLELLVVVVIIGLLAGLVAPRYFDSVSKSKSKIAKAQIESLDKALDQYRLDVGSYPTTEQGLNALSAQPTGVAKWQGPYLKKALPADPWGNDYAYVLQPGASAIDIISYGADGKPGGTGEAQDISLHSTN
ncbi:type II secretion system major pseudopilin GspG [Polaromonas sp.]|uniref:type II secretion system major pseudopilin GspG n=1 Tax=Polaromonas sp. TaxID=1869339 RepID=UPI0032648849